MPSHIIEQQQHNKVTMSLSIGRESKHHSRTEVVRRCTAGDESATMGTHSWPHSSSIPVQSGKHENLTDGLQRWRETSSYPAMIKSKANNNEILFDGLYTQWLLRLHQRYKPGAKWWLLPLTYNFLSGPSALDGLPSACLCSLSYIRDCLFA